MSGNAWEKRMRKQFFGFALGLLIFALCTSAEAQQQGKIPKIRELLFRPGSTLGTGREVFRRSLRELGYVEGKSIVYEARSAEGKLDQFPVFAAELVLK
jgi:putative ABC transport system substrate-binding protein